MIVFPNAKINLGLNIISRRPDGYHDLDMVMIPVGWCDILEVVPARSGATTLTTSGRPVDCPTEKNLVYKAWKYLYDYLGGKLPPVDIYLHKVIPDGAGLGGGSSDAAFTLSSLNRLFSLGLSDETLCDIASRLGADCPFFIRNRPMLCRATGTDLSPVNVRLDDINAILIAKPRQISVSTAEAYSGVIPAVPLETTDSIVSASPPSSWRGRLINGFENHIFRMKPQIADVKQRIIDAGAVYASMSGSGSAVYGLFDNVKMAEQTAAGMTDCDCYVDILAESLLF